MSLDGGHVGIGTTSPDNSEGWNRVLDVVGERHGKVSLRTTAGKLDGRVMLHEDGFFGAPAGMVVGTKTSHPLSLATAGATRLTLTSDGHLGIGTTTVDNAEKWARIVDLYSRFNFRVNLRTDRVEGRLMVHDDGIWGGERGMILGTKSADFALGLATAGATRLTVAPDGSVGIGTTRPENRDRAGQYVEVFGKASAQLAIRTGAIESYLIATDAAAGPNPAGLVLGTRSPHPVTLSTGGRPVLQATREQIDLPESGVISRAPGREGPHDGPGPVLADAGELDPAGHHRRPDRLLHRRRRGQGPRDDDQPERPGRGAGHAVRRQRPQLLLGPGRIMEERPEPVERVCGSVPTGGPSDARLKTAVRPLREALASVLG